MSKKPKSPERFAQIPLDAMQSKAYRWLPPFAKCVLFALAAQFTGYNSGGLELTVKDGKAFGLTEDELIAGLALCILAGFVKRTVEARRRSGTGAPARSALTWRRMGDFPRFNIAPTFSPTNDWQAFEEPFARPRSLRGAWIALGYRSARPSRLHTLSPRSKRVPVTRPVKNGSMAGHAHLKGAVMAGHAPGEEPVTLPVKKNRPARLRIVSD